MAFIGPNPVDRVLTGFVGEKAFVTILRKIENEITQCISFILFIYALNL